MTEPLDDNRKVRDGSQEDSDLRGLRHGLESYWGGLLERVRRESEAIPSKENQRKEGRKLSDGRPS